MSDVREKNRISLFYVDEKTRFDFTFFHGSWWLAGSSSDDRRDHVVVVFQIDERCGIPTWWNVGDRSLSGHWSRNRDRRRK